MEFVRSLFGRSQQVAASVKEEPELAEAKGLEEKNETRLKCEQQADGAVFMEENVGNGDSITKNSVPDNLLQWNLRKKAFLCSRSPERFPSETDSISTVADESFDDDSFIERGSVTANPEDPFLETPATHLSKIFSRLALDTPNPSSGHSEISFDNLDSTVIHIESTSAQEKDASLPQEGTNIQEKGDNEPPNVHGINCTTQAELDSPRKTECLSNNKDPELIPTEPITADASEHCIQAVFIKEKHAIDDSSVESNNEGTLIDENKPVKCSFREGNLENPGKNNLFAQDNTAPLPERDEDDNTMEDTTGKRMGSLRKSLVETCPPNEVLKLEGWEKESPQSSEMEKTPTKQDVGFSESKSTEESSPLRLLSGFTPNPFGKLSSNNSETILTHETKSTNEVDAGKSLAEDIGLVKVAISVEPGASKEELSIEEARDEQVSLNLLKFSEETATKHLLPTKSSETINQRANSDESQAGKSIAENNAMSGEPCTSRQEVDVDDVSLKCSEEAAIDVSHSLPPTISEINLTNDLNEARTGTSITESNGLVKDPNSGKPCASREELSSEDVVNKQVPVSMMKCSEEAADDQDVDASHSLSSEDVVDKQVPVSMMKCSEETANEQDVDASHSLSTNTSETNSVDGAQTAKTIMQDKEIVNVPNVVQPCASKHELSSEDAVDVQDSVMLKSSEEVANEQRMDASHSLSPKVLERIPNSDVAEAQDGTRKMEDYVPMKIAMSVGYDASKEGLSTEDVVDEQVSVNMLEAAHEHDVDTLLSFPLNISGTNPHFKLDEVQAVASTIGDDSMLKDVVSVEPSASEEGLSSQVVDGQISVNMLKSCEEATRDVDMLRSRSSNNSEAYNQEENLNSDINQVQVCREGNELMMSGGPSTSSDVVDKQVSVSRSAGVHEQVVDASHSLSPKTSETNLNNGTTEVNQLVKPIFSGEPCSSKEELSSEGVGNEKIPVTLLKRYEETKDVQDTAVSHSSSPKILKSTPNNNVDKAQACTTATEENELLLKHSKETVKESKKQIKPTGKKISSGKPLKLHLKTKAEASKTSPKKPVESKATDINKSPIIAAKSGYNLDFLDDENFNPFETKVKVNASPLRSMDVECSRRDETDETSPTVTEDVNQLLDDESNQLLHNESNQVIHDESNQVIHDEPNQIIHDESNQILYDESNQVLYNEPSEILTNEPSQKLTNEPSHILSNEPNEILTDELVKEEEPDDFNKLEADVSVIAAELQNSSLQMDSKEASPDSVEILDIDHLPLDAPIESGFGSITQSSDVSCFVSATQSSDIQDLGSVAQANDFQSTRESVSSFTSRDINANVEPEEQFTSATKFFSEADLETLEYCGIQGREPTIARQSLYFKFDPLLGKPISAVAPQVKKVNEGTDLMMTRTPPNASAPLISFNSPSTPATTAKIPPTPANTLFASIEEERARMLREHEEDLRVKEQVHTANLLRLQRDYDEKLKQMENKYQQQLKQEDEKYQKDLNEKKQECQEFQKAMEAYVKTVSELIEKKSEMDRRVGELHEEVQKVKQEKSQAIAELKEMETTFHQFNQKYERTKEIAASQMENEKVLKKTVDELTSTVEKQKQKYKNLKSHAEEKLAEASKLFAEEQEKFSTLEKQKEIIVKKSDMKINGLEAALKQKEEENAELSAICDEIINKVGQYK